MNYRHLYHAGNFADVMKHLILLSLLQALRRKEKPFCYLDTHAGIGCYDLTSAVTQKQREYTGGITKLVAGKDTPPLVGQYLEIIKAINTDKLTQYPGSPYFAKQLLRETDRIVLCELHPEDVHTLKSLFKYEQQVAVHHADGYQGLKAFLPPKEKRGLILIDPPFENADEFKTIIDNLSIALNRFVQGVYAIWYPLKDKHSVQRFKRQLLNLPAHNILDIQLAINEINPMLGLNGSGVTIINAPWQIDQELKSLMSWLWQVLAVEQRGFHRVEWLLPPR